MTPLKPDDFDVRQLAVFCKIVELKNFTRAAEALFLTQPTLSARIADLERKVGARLLDRRARAVLPTKAGEILYRHAKALLKQRGAAIEELSAFLGVLSGDLIIGASTIPGEYILPPIVAVFKRENPGIAVRMIIADSQGVIDQVAGGAVEVGVVGARPQNGSLHAARLVDDELVLIVHHTHPLASSKSVTIEEVVTEPFIDREPGSGTRRALESSLRQRGLRLDRDLNVIIEAGSTEAVKQCVEAGAGVAILSRRAIGCEVKVGTIKALPIRDLKLTRSFYTIRSRDRTPSPICRAFVQFLKSHMDDAA